MDGGIRLLNKAIKGDVRCFEQLAQPLLKPVYNYCLRMLRNREDAEDISQEVFIKAYRNVTSFEGRSSFSTWIYKIAYNTVVDYTRKKRLTTITIHNRGEDGDRDMELPDVINEPGRMLMQSERQRELLAAIYSLRDEYKEVIIMRDIEDAPYQQMADVLELPLGTVKTRIRRARLAVRKKLDESKEGGEPDGRIQ